MRRQLVRGVGPGVLSPEAGVQRRMALTDGSGYGMWPGVRTDDRCRHFLQADGTAGKGGADRRAALEVPVTWRVREKAPAVRETDRGRLS